MKPVASPKIMKVDGLKRHARARGHPGVRGGVARAGPDRGRKKRELPPPSEPYKQISRIRLSSWWFTCERIGRPLHGLWPRRTAPAWQNRRWASVDGQDLIHQAEPFASFHPLFEGRQHTFRPDRRFHPCPAGMDLSGLFSLFRHCRRWLFRRSVLHAFHLPARPSLRIHYRCLIATMGALTPALAFAALRLGTSMNTALCPPRRSPCFTCTAFRSFRLHPPDSPLRRFPTLPFSAQSFRRVARGLDFAIESQARRSARPYRVRYPTDWSFTSRCFGPHLSMTPLRLITGRRAHA